MKIKGRGRESVSFGELRLPGPATHRINPARPADPCRTLWGFPTGSPAAAVTRLGGFRPPCVRFLPVSASDWLSRHTFPSRFALDRTPSCRSRPAPARTRHGRAKDRTVARLFALMDRAEPSSIVPLRQKSAATGEWRPLERLPACGLQGDWNASACNEPGLALLLTSITPF
jgi:hypothetical protein